MLPLSNPRSSVPLIAAPATRSFSYTGRGDTVEADLRELWRHEMRQSERVRAFPRADEVVVEVLSFGETDDDF